MSAGKNDLEGVEEICERRDDRQLVNEEADMLEKKDREFEESEEK